MFLRNFLNNLKKIGPSITNYTEKSLIKNSSIRSKSSYIFPTILIGTIIYENHEKFFSMIGLSQSRLKKRIDKWKGIDEELDKTIDLKISDLVKFFILNLKNLLNEEDYLIKITQPVDEKPQAEQNITQETNELSSQEKSDYLELSKLSETLQVKFRKEIELNKKNLIVNLIEKEELLDSLMKEKQNLLIQIKSERSNQNKIINQLKDKLGKDEFMNLEKIRQVLGEEKLQPEQLNVINLVLPQGDNYKSLNASVEDLNKLTLDYNKINNHLLNLDSEITILNDNLKKFNQLEEIYKAEINSVLKSNIPSISSLSEKNMMHYEVKVKYL